MNPTALADSRGRPLACYAIDSTWNLIGIRVPHTSIVRYLLDKGARLHQIFEGKTLWQFAVARACNDGLERSASRDLWVELLQLLLDYGANPKVQNSVQNPAVCGHQTSLRWVFITSLDRFVSSQFVGQQRATATDQSQKPQYHHSR